MRRTLLTLLAAVCAFGVLTASYATAELPRDQIEASTTAN
jgi:predicted outer membrane lipoprotein